MIKKPKSKSSSSEGRTAHDVKTTENSVQYIRVTLGPTTVKKRTSNQVATVRAKNRAAQSGYAVREVTPLQGIVVMPPITVDRPKPHPFSHTSGMPAQANKGIDEKLFAGKLFTSKKDASQYAAEIEAVTAILRRLVKPEAVQPWFHKRIPGLGQRKPIDVIRGGGVAQVIEVLTQVGEGIHI